MGANEKKSKQLGMPVGTANARLRKLILFRLVQEAKKDTCFRCSKRIETVEKFSIEHKKEWLDVTTELFWSWENIAFSHLSCNIAAARKPNKKFFTDEERAASKRRRNAATKRKTYTPDRRREKYDRTGH